jgi:hypothetical protein
METIKTLLSNDAVLTLIVAIIGAAWAAFQGSAAWARIKNAKYAKAIRALEAGVELTYQTYVRSIKDSRADGTLTAAEMSAARAKAKEAAIQFASQEGVDMVKEVGPDYLDLAIAKIVIKMQTGTVTVPEQGAVQ